MGAGSCTGQCSRGSCPGGAEPPLAAVGKSLARAGPFGLWESGRLCPQEGIAEQRIAQTGRLPPRLGALEGGVLCQPARLPQLAR